MEHIYEAEKICGREYRSALEQAIYLTWSTGKETHGDDVSRGDGSRL